MNDMIRLFVTYKIKAKEGICKYIVTCGDSCLHCNKKDCDYIYPEVTNNTYKALLDILTSDDNFSLVLNKNFISWSDKIYLIKATNLIDIACKIYNKFGENHLVVKKIKEYNWYQKE